MSPTNRLRNAPSAAVPCTSQFSRRKNFKAPLPLDQIYREALNSTTSNGKNESKERQPNAVVKSVVAIK
jgi:hypothetical protein